MRESFRCSHQGTSAACSYFLYSRIPRSLAWRRTEPTRRSSSWAARAALALLFASCKSLSASAGVQSWSSLLEITFGIAHFPFAFSPWACKSKIHGRQYLHRYHRLDWMCLRASASSLPGSHGSVARRQVELPSAGYRQWRTRRHHRSFSFPLRLQLKRYFFAISVSSNSLSASISSAWTS